MPGSIHEELSRIEIVCIFRAIARRSLGGKIVEKKIDVCQWMSIAFARMARP